MFLTGFRPGVNEVLTENIVNPRDKIYNYPGVVKSLAGTRKALYIKKYLTYHTFISI